MRARWPSKNTKPALGLPSMARGPVFMPEAGKPTPYGRAAWMDTLCGISTALVHFAPSMWLAGIKPGLSHHYRRGLMAKRTDICLALSRPQ